MSRFIRERYRDFESYTPGEQPKNIRYIKLNTNESPFPPAPEVLRAVDEALLERLRLYPDPTGSALKEKLAALYGVSKENVFLSNGSDDILNFTFMAYNGTAPFAFPDITYSFYEVIAGLHDARTVQIPLEEDLSVDYRKYIGIDANIVLANPNAPTGMALPLSEIEAIVQGNPDHVVLIDEAYVDFGAESAVPLTKKYDNIIVSRTFSKSRSFAGGRLGFAIADEGLIGDLLKMQYSTNPYNVNTLSLALGEAAVDADAYYTANARTIIETREETAEALLALGFEVLPSRANFLFARHRTVSGGELYERLREEGILVRHFTRDRIRDFNRISIGSREEMKVFLEKTARIVEA